MTVNFAVEIDSVTGDAAHDFAAESRDSDAVSDPEMWGWVGLQSQRLIDLPPSSVPAAALVRAPGYGIDAANAAGVR